jgi:putative ABC transport system permease protein
VSAAGVLVAIYNSLASRRRDIAILRALGAGRMFLSGAIVLEAAVIGAIGMVLAFAAYAAIVSAVAAVIQAQTGVLLEAFTYNPVMLWAPLGMIGLCALSGLLPAMKAYRTDVAENLAPIS